MRSSPSGSWSWRSAPSAAAASSSSRTRGPTRASRGSSASSRRAAPAGLFIPLLVRDEAIGALAVYRRRPRPYREGEESLLLALSGQLAVAVQNARLHERAKELSKILERTLESERLAARQLRGLYAVSQSFAESLSLEATLDGVARAMVDLLDADAAVIRMPDERNEVLTARAVHVRDPAVEEVVAGLVARPQPLSAPLARRLLRSSRPCCSSPERPRRRTRTECSSPSSGRAPPRRPPAGDARQGARDADGRLLRPVAPARRVGDRRRDCRRGAGRPGDRQRPPLQQQREFAAHAALAPPRELPRVPASRSATSTSRRRGSTSAATSTTSSHSATAGSRS